MRYYASTALNTSIALPDGHRMRVLPSFRQITEDEYYDLNGRIVAEAAAELEVDEDDDLDEVIDETVEDDDDSDILSSMIDDDEDDDEDEDDDSSVVLDDSVIKQEEKASANEFESIKTLRDQADKTKEARVTKGKAHGVYAYKEEAWVKVGEI